MTAFETGTADDYEDLWDKLLAFLTSDSALVSAGEDWAVAWTHPDGAASGVVLRGPGLSNSDEIYVGLERVDDEVNDGYTIWARGMTGTLDDSEALADHINVSPRVAIHPDGEAMTYWFIASGRRFIVILKISTVFQALYCGFFLPYGTPLSYPYPMFIGGSRGELNDPAQKDWRSVSAGHTMFFSPHHGVNSSGSATVISPSSYMLDPIGQWLPGFSTGTDPISIWGGRFALAPDFFLADAQNWGFTQNASGSPTYQFGYRQFRYALEDCYGGDYPLLDISLISSLPEDQSWGVLDGVYRVAAVGNASENIVQYDGKDHLVVQNVYKTDTGDYMAVVLE